MSVYLNDLFLFYVCMLFNIMIFFIYVHMGLN